MFANFDVTSRFLFTVILACNKLQPSKAQGCPFLPCEYGGTCVNNVCSCPPGLTGPTCSNVDCSNYPCYYGGTCVPGPPDMCICPFQFPIVQPFCTISCQNQPCVNGTCVGDVCNCDTNFAGPRCESAIAAYLSPTTITVTEGHVGLKEVTVQVCRQPSSEEVTLAVSTTPFSGSITALPDVDFVDIPFNPRQYVTISAGQPCTPVNVFIISDLTQEIMSKRFTLDFDDPQPSSSMVHFVTGSFTSITIIDDDPGVKKTKQNTTKKPWTTEEKQVVARIFKSCFLKNNLPGKDKIMTAINAEPTLQSRMWRNIKVFIRNQNRKSDPLSFVTL